MLVVYALQSLASRRVVVGATYMSLARTRGLRGMIFSFLKGCTIRWKLIIVLPHI